MTKCLKGLLLLLTLTCALPSGAYDFARKSGKTKIYYNIISKDKSKTVEVTYKDEKFGSYSGNVVIPSKVTYFSETYKVIRIGENAFSGCTGLTSVTFESAGQLLVIGHSAFRGCSALYTMEIPEGVTKIGDYVFWGDTSLASVVIPESVDAMGIHSFVGCASLTQLEFNSAACGMRAGRDDNSFFGCTSLEEVTIGGSVKTMPESLFAGNPRLKTVNFGAKACDAAGSGDFPVFAGCTGLETVNFADSVTVIPESLFDGRLSDCFPRLKSLVIPRSVNEMGARAFASCSALTDVTFKAKECLSAGTEKHPVFEESPAVEKITLGPDVTVIPSGLFDARLSEGFPSLTGIIIPSRVTSVGDRAWAGCTALKTVTIEGAALESIGSYAFYDTRSLRTLKLPASVRTIGDYAFWGCRSLVKADLSSGLKTIGDYAFWSSNLPEIEVPDGTTSIGSYAFARSENLIWANLPASLTFLGDYAFDGCAAMKNANPEGTCIRKIGAGTFRGCVSLVSMSVPATAEEVGSEAFEGCKNLRIVGWRGEPAVKVIGKEAFCGCDSLTSIVIPRGVNEIGENAFASCRHLSGVDFRAAACPSAGSKENPAFSGCIALKNVTIEDGVETVPAYLFRYNGDKTGFTEFTSLTIPQSVKTVGEDAFFGDGCLAEVSIEGENLETVGAGAFGFCASLKSLTLPSSLKSVGNSAFVWSGLESVCMPSSASLGTEAFASCTCLKDVTWTGGDGEMTIGNSAFYNCTVLEKIILPENLTRLGESVFYGCLTLSGVEYDAVSCTVAGSEEDPVFSYCGAIENVTIGDGVKVIPDDLFNSFGYDYTKFRKIVIPASVESLGERCFRGCPDMTEVYALAAEPARCGEYAFRNVSSSCVLYVPAGSEAKYAAADGKKNTWDDFEDIRAVVVLDIDKESDIEGDEEGYGYATCYNGFYPYSLPDGLKGSTVGGTSGGSGGSRTLVLEWQYGGGGKTVSVPAGTAVLLYGPMGKCLAPVTYAENSGRTDLNGRCIDDSPAPEGNCLYGSDTETETYAVRDGARTTEGYYFYKLTYKNGKHLGFYWGEKKGAPFTSGAGLAWLALETDAAGKSGNVTISGQGK